MSERVGAAIKIVAVSAITPQLRHRFWNMKVVQLLETLTHKVRITMNLINLVIMLIGMVAVRLLTKVGIIYIIAQLQ